MTTAVLNSERDLRPKNSTCESSLVYSLILHVIFCAVATYFHIPMRGRDGGDWRHGRSVNVKLVSSAAGIPLPKESVVVPEKQSRRSDQRPLQRRTEANLPSLRPTPRKNSKDLKNEKPLPPTRSLQETKQDSSSAQRRSLRQGRQSRFTHWVCPDTRRRIQRSLHSRPRRRRFCHALWLVYRSRKEPYLRQLAAMDHRRGRPQLAHHSLLHHVHYKPRRLPQRRSHLRIQR